MYNKDIEKVVIKDPDGKLYSLGFMDGKEKAFRILNGPNPNDNISKLNPVGTPEYLKGYRDGINAAKKEYDEIHKISKTIK